jgi:hypothetical protein
MTSWKLKAATGFRVYPFETPHHVTTLLVLESALTEEDKFLISAPFDSFSIDILTLRICRATIIFTHRPILSFPYSLSRNVSQVYGSVVNYKVQRSLSSDVLGYVRESFYIVYYYTSVRTLTSTLLRYTTAPSGHTAPSHLNYFVLPSVCKDTNIPSPEHPNSFICFYFIYFFTCMYNPSPRNWMGRYHGPAVLALYTSPNPQIPKSPKSTNSQILLSRVAPDDKINMKREIPPPSQGVHAKLGHYINPCWFKTSLFS